MENDPRYRGALRWCIESWGGTSLAVALDAVQQWRKEMNPHAPAYHFAPLTIAEVVRIAEARISGYPYTEATWCCDERGECLT